MDLGLALIPRAASLFIRLLHGLVRARHVHLDRIEALHRSGRNYMLALWHGHFLLMVHARFRRPICVMISQSRDGELIARTLAPFGIDAARGSSSRGGSAALKELVAVAGSGANIAITPDGPRGPRRVAQIGVVRASQLAGIPIMPVAIAAERKWVARSWDRTEVPKPFSRIAYVYGEPIQVPAQVDEAGLEEWRREVERRLTALSEDAERDFDALWKSGVR